MKRAREASNPQSVLDIVTAVPVLDGFLAYSREIRMACNERWTIGMGNPPGATGEPRVAGHQPPCIGESIVRPWETDRVQFPAASQHPLRPDRLGSLKSG